MLKLLTRYTYISITRLSPYFSASFGHAYDLVDEGSFYCLADLHIIKKNNVAKVDIEEDVVRITYKDGKVVELGIIG